MTEHCGNIYVFIVTDGSFSHKPGHASPVSLTTIVGAVRLIIATDHMSKVVHDIAMDII